MKLSDYVWQRIAAEGVKDVFYLPGGGCMHLVDSLGKNKDIRPISCLHEQGAAIATDAYAQVQGFGCCLVTTGPGGTNALTGVAAAWCDSTPMIVISGQVKTADLKGDLGVRQLGFQELNIIEIVKSITKYAVTVTDPKTIRYHLDWAFYWATTGRKGPVWIDIPLDVQAVEIEPGDLIGLAYPETLPYGDFTESAGAIKTLLDKSERPAMLIGNGCRDCIPQALEFAERFDIPILTTWKAIDFLPDDHPLFAGRPGAAGQLGANLTQQNADLLLVFGARLDHGQIAYMQDTFAPKAVKVIVDIDPAELKKFKKMRFEGFVCDTKEMLGVLLEKTLGERKKHPQWVKQVLDWKAAYPVIKPEYRQEKLCVNTYTLVEELSKYLGENDLLVPGSSGQCSEIVHQAWRVNKGLRILNSQGLGSMGFGVPAALGACIASGGKRTVVIEGDGGFAMNTQELEVIRRLNLPIKIFVLDNGGYGSIRGTQRAYFDGRLVGSDRSSGLTLPSCTDVAFSYWIFGQNMFESRDLKRIEEILKEPGPFVIQVMVNPDQQTIPRVQSYRKADGGMATKPMDEMYLGPSSP